VDRHVTGGERLGRDSRIAAPGRAGRVFYDLGVSFTSSAVSAEPPRP
jgi:hypothetical protein